MHVTREWSCTAGFTKDEYPIIGLIDGKRQYIIAGMCGSGSSVHFNGARHVIQKILGIQSQDDYPEEFFSPTRILEPKSHKWPSLDG
jgi:glycine/D-amino acid oxidase-like deaminating enzyme